MDVVDDYLAVLHLVQNDAESWVPIAEWALELRRQGKAVLFVAHAGKSKQQRGTSKKEDVMDVVIKLDHSQDYQQQKKTGLLKAAIVSQPFWRRSQECRGNQQNGECPDVADPLDRPNCKL